MNEIHWAQLLPHEQFSITHEEFEQFKRWYVMYALADKRFGQAFCEHYGMRGVLYHFKDRKIAERWIEDNYLEQ